MKNQKYLVLNAGSSSIKFQLYSVNGNKEEVVAKGLIERIGVDGVTTIKFNGHEHVYKDKLKNHEEGINFLFKSLTNLKVIESFKDIKAIGHRVVHGGPSLTKSMLIDAKVLKEIELACDIAPLHNPPALKVIEACKKKTTCKNVAVFDTAFHATIPSNNYLYGIKKEWSDKYKVKRYGFHGISYQYILANLEKILKKDKSKINAIVCHLGNGASVTAIKEGKSYNTSMGFTPSEGLIMGTRAGDIDFMIIEYIAKKINKSTADVINMLNKESGILGLTTKSPDFRDLSKGFLAKDKTHVQAMEVFISRIVKYIAWYANEFENGKIDALVFTAGMGENAALLRELVASKLNTLPVKLDKKANESSYSDYELISAKSSKTKVFKIRTNEELMILKDTIKLSK